MDKKGIKGEEMKDELKFYKNEIIRMIKECEEKRFLRQIWTIVRKHNERNRN